jgi:hypothetical protein
MDCTVKPRNDRPIALPTRFARMPPLGYPYPYANLRLTLTLPARTPLLTRVSPYGLTIGSMVARLGVWCLRGCAGGMDGLHGQAAQ